MDTADVKHYYDQNTAWFLRFGQGAKTQTIHRAVWGPGVDERDRAFHFIEDQIHAHLQAVAHSSEPPLVADLGCGVGASLVYLARRIPMRGLGVTLSPVQAELARRRFGELGLQAELECHEGSYLELPCASGRVQLAYAIESFVLGPDPRAFFREAARVLAPGGRLVVCDDFATPQAKASSLPARERRWQDDFRRGWHARSLVGVEHAQALAREAGLDAVEDRDLTPYLELRRPRDRLITALVAAGRRIPLRHPWWLNLLGGNALQMGLVHGLIEYRFLVWTKPS